MEFIDLGTEETTVLILGCYRMYDLLESWNSCFPMVLSPSSISVKHTRMQTEIEGMVSKFKKFQKF